MRIKPEQLQQHLQQPLASCYLIHGDETLLIQEAADAVRSKARGEGFLERELFHVEGHFDWNQIGTADQAMSLFTSRKLIELRLPSGKPGDAGSKYLQQLIHNQNPDNMLLICSGKIDTNAQRSKWYKAIQQTGVCIAVWPLEQGSIASWIKHRAKTMQLILTDDAACMLAERTEGNLLATQQELEKFTLLPDNDSIGIEQVDSQVGLHARYSSFQLVDAALGGDARRSLNILYGLHQEGTEALTLIWVFARNIRLLERLLQHPQGIEAGLCQERVWDKRKAFFNYAAKHHTTQSCATLLRLCQRIDQAQKGIGMDNIWDRLTDLTLGLARASWILSPDRLSNIDIAYV
jgi:DNA polymerase-3 subunit delta